MFLNLIVRFLTDDSSTIVDLLTMKNRIIFDIYNFVSIAEFLIVMIKNSDSFAFDTLKQTGKHDSPVRGVDYESVLSRRFIYIE